MNFQNSRIIVSTYSRIETIYDAITKNSSWSQQGENKHTGTYCMYTGMYYTRAYNGLPSPLTAILYSPYSCVNIILFENKFKTDWPLLMGQSKTLSFQQKKPGCIIRPTPLWSQTVHGYCKSSTLVMYLQTTSNIISRACTHEQLINFQDIYMTYHATLNKFMPNPTCIRYSLYI